MLNWILYKIFFEDGTTQESSAWKRKICRTDGLTGTNEVQERYLTTISTRFEETIYNLLPTSFLKILYRQKLFYLAVVSVAAKLWKDRSFDAP
ncbi:MAG: hypothetical protein IPP81_04315 [Chitinophagaceae bacterium]|nr:hypothetical protein [Chitinophagaceae bacterium]